MTWWKLKQVQTALEQNRRLFPLSSAELPPVRPCNFEISPLLLLLSSIKWFAMTVASQFLHLPWYNLTDLQSEQSVMRLTTLTRRENFGHVQWLMTCQQNSDLRCKKKRIIKSIQWWRELEVWSKWVLWIVTDHISKNSSWKCLWKGVCRRS